MIWTKPKTWESTDMINISDWQRIEDNTKLISDFYDAVTQFKTWHHTDFPKSSEVLRMESNINAVLKKWEKSFSGTKIEMDNIFPGTLSSLIIFGKTLEIGSGEKSPDNPYTFQPTKSVTVKSGTLEQTYAVNNDGLPDGTSDSVNVVSGESAIRVWRWTLKGTENWSRENTDTAGFYRWKFARSDMLHKQSDINQVISTHYISALDATQKRIQSVSLSTGDEGAIYIYDEKHAQSSLDDWKAYLKAQYDAGTPVIVAYKANTTAYRTLTPKSIEIYAPYTVITNNTGTYMEAAAVAASHTFQSKFDWNLLNEMESLISQVYEYVKELQFSVKRMGTFSAGQQLYFPLGGNL